MKYNCTTIQKFRAGGIFLCSLNTNILCSTKMDLFNKNAVKTVLLRNIITIYMFYFNIF